MIGLQFFITFSFLLFSESVFAICIFSEINTCNPDTVNAHVSDLVVGNNSLRVSNLFSLNSDFYTLQGSITDPNGNVNPEAIQILKTAGVPLIRHSGAPNELRWNQCIGEPSKRPLQNVLTWRGPITCIFGVEEYDRLSQSINSTRRWYLANMMGFEFKESTSKLMAVNAANFASYTKRANKGTQIYWELGNELLDGAPKWSKEKYVTRVIEIANSIKSSDPQAEFVVPLMIFNTGWEKDYLGVDRFVVEKTRSLNPAYSVHTYYENKPEGLFVEEWVERIKKIEHQIRLAGVERPRIWVSEHARWPKGNPKVQDWKNNWYQTNNYDAVLHVSSYLMLLSQLESVEGAMWHALRGGPWNFIHVDGAKNLTPSGVALLFSFLNLDRENMDVLKLQTKERLNGLAITALRNRRTGQLHFWCANKTDKPIEVSISGDKLLLEGKVFDSRFIQGMTEEKSGVRLNIREQGMARVSTQTITIKVMPRSIYSIASRLKAL